jgi:SAM-dependent methyltransferase
VHAEQHLSGDELAWLKKNLSLYANELTVCVSLLEGIDLSGRVLEIGAGIGALSAYLRLHNVNITALEPGAAGYDRFGKLCRLVFDFFAVEVPLLRLPVEDLGKDHGKHDVVYSVNVLEHVRDLAQAFLAMKAVLDKRGVMKHTCPNYLIPYEPHVGLPLVPFRPRLTQMVATRLRMDEIWKSLNFVTYQQIVALCDGNDFDVTFERDQTYRAFARLGFDSEFRSRQGAPVRALASVLKRTGGLKLLRSIPPWLSTPMTFTCFHRDRP